MGELIRWLWLLCAFLVKITIRLGKQILATGAYVYCKLRRPYLLDLRDRGEGHGYKGEPTDRGHLMLIACFTLLRDFVEKEWPDIGFLSEKAYRSMDRVLDEQNRELVRQQMEIDRQLRELYDWWMQERTLEYAAIDRESDGWEDRLDRLNDKDDVQLLRLIRLRNQLWV